MVLSFLNDTMDMVNRMIRAAREPEPYVDPATMFTAAGPVGPQASGVIPSPPSFSNSAGMVANQPISTFGTALPPPPPPPPPMAAAPPVQAAPAPFPSPAGPVPQHVIESTLFGGGMPLAPNNLPPLPPPTNPYEQFASRVLGGTMPWNTAQPPPTTGLIAPSQLRAQVQDMPLYDRAPAIQNVETRAPGFLSSGLQAPQGAREGFGNLAADALRIADMPREYIGAPLAGATLGRFAEDDGSFSLGSIGRGLADTPRAMTVPGLGLAGAGITDLLRPGGYQDAREQSEAIRSNLPTGAQIGYDVLTDPLMYVGPGAARTLSTRLPAALRPALTGSRNPIGAIVEGVGPARVLPTAVGAGAGTTIAEELGAPSWVGSTVGAVLGSAATNLRRPPMQSAVTGEPPRGPLPPEMTPVGRPSPAANIEPLPSRGQKVPAPRSFQQPEGELAGAIEAIRAGVREEASIRRRGVAAAEIAEGRGTQVKNYDQLLREGIDAGLSPEAAAAQARRGLAVGPLRSTTAEVPLTPTQRAALYEGVNEAFRTGELSAFDHVRAVTALDRLLRGDGLQPNEARIVSRLLGDEVAKAGVARGAPNNVELARTEKFLEQEVRKADVALTRAQRQADIAETNAQSRADLRAFHERYKEMARNGEISEEVSQRMMTPEERRIMERYKKVQDARTQREWAAAQLEAGKANQARVRAEQRYQQQSKAYLDRFDRLIREDYERDLKQTQAWLDKENAAARAESSKAAQRGVRAEIDAQDMADKAAQRERWKTIARQNEIEQRYIDELNRPFSMTEEMRNIGRRELDARNERLQSEAGEFAETAMRKVAPERMSQVIDEIRKQYPDMPDDASMLENIVTTWQKQNEFLTERITANPNRARRLTDAVQAVATGRINDPYVAAVVTRQVHLERALELAGMSREAARSITDAAGRIQLQRRYPAGVPPEIDELLASTRASFTSNTNAVEAAGQIVQEWKNLQFGIGDFAVLFQQGLKSGVTGSVPILAGLTNRMLALAHLPSMSMDAGNHLPRAIAAQLDGVAQGIKVGITDNIEEGSILRHIPGLKGVDRQAMRLAQAMTDFQFGTILTSIRNLNYEGNLVLAKMAGADIQDSRIRQQAASFANHNTSYAPLAQSSNRRAFERAALLSAPMRRAQVNQILQVSEGLTRDLALAAKGDPEARVRAGLAAATIVSAVASVYLTKKAMFDWLELTEPGEDFDFDPRSRGFGYMTLKGGKVINPFPQLQIMKAIAQSVQALEDNDYSDLGEAWQRLALGSGSPVARVAAQALGYGFEPGVGWRLGDYNPSEKPVWMRLTEAFAPPIVSEVVREGMDPYTLLEAGGQPVFDEGPRDRLSRDYKNETGRDYWEDIKDREGRAQIDSWIESTGRQELEREATERDAERGNEGAQRALASDAATEEQLAEQKKRDEAFRAGDMAPADWRAARNQRNEFYRGRREQVYADVEPGPEKDAVDRYYRIIEDATEAGIVDWDEVEGRVQLLPAADRKFIEENTGGGGTQVEKEYKRDVKAIADSGYWDIPDALAKYYGEYVGLQVSSQAELRDIVRQGIIQHSGLNPADWREREMIDKWVDQELKPYTDWVTKERKAFREQSPQITNLLIKWDYKEPNMDELGTLLTDESYTDEELGGANDAADSQ